MLAKVTRPFKNAKTQVLVFTNADTFAITTNNESLRTLKREARERGIKLRYITEITKENLSFCKQQMTLVDELRHLDRARGNFVLSESEFIVSPEISEKYPMTNGTYGDIDSMLRQYWHLFETLWNHAIPAEHRVKELETITGSDTKTIHDKAIDRFYTCNECPSVFVYQKDIQEHQLAIRDIRNIHSEYPSLRARWLMASYFQT